ncbi:MULTISPECIES: hypothetical protein [Spiroplasma]|uniref:hypothetical protein n=1 Tax=Spiroplasma TaxID=2132 RepID=UPI0018DB4DFA|nr:MULTISPECIES: hypothetical protein [Spiroplasma]MBH8623105.1 hypothetical protein [Spiroplasma sp. hyd1]UNF61966.1 hypothetical protein MNU24_00425 [Spiroplasma poulsonii]
MKRLLTMFSALTVFSAPVTAVSCNNFATRDRSKISLALFKTQLALVPVFDHQNTIATVTEPIFQNAIYEALETNQYRGEVASNELEFTYYQQGTTPTSWTDLTWQQIPSGSEKTTFINVKIKANATSVHFADTTEIIAIALYRTQPADLETIKFNYKTKVLATLLVSEMMEYFAVLNPTFYFTPRHFEIQKTATEVEIIAAKNSERYIGKNVITWS